MGSFFSLGFTAMRLDASKTDDTKVFVVGSGSPFISCAAKGSTVACPYSIFLRYVSLAGFSSDSKTVLFRQVYRSGSICKLINKDTKLSYTAAREALYLNEPRENINIIYTINDINK
jgi:hypothetical protein